jgi:hypothetical protein
VASAAVSPTGELAKLRAKEDAIFRTYVVIMKALGVVFLLTLIVCARKFSTVNAPAIKATFKQKDA